MIREYLNSKDGKKIIKKEAEYIHLKYFSDINISDVENELYLLILENEQEYKPEYSVFTFIKNCILSKLIYRITKNYYYREKNNKGIYEIIEENEFTDIEIENDIEEIIFVHACLNSLNKEEKKIIRLRMNDITLEEIGNQFGITKEAVRQRINKIANKIKV